MAESPPTSRAGRIRQWRFAVLGVASATVLGLLLYSIGAFGPPASAGPATTTSTSYSLTAASVVGSVSTDPPDGYQQGSSGPLSPSESGLTSGGYATFHKPGGSAANVTVLVFDSQQSAQAYAEGVISGAKDLPGYTNVTAAISAYRHYGVCYGFGEADPEGNGAVANGLCTKGNVFIQVHVVSSVSLSSARGDMADLVGAAYQGEN